MPIPKGEPINHQPFEEWLLNDKNLTPAEKRELDLHLRTCTHCTALSATGLALRSAPVASPAAGFTLRFQQRLAAQKDRRTPPQIMGHDHITGKRIMPARLVHSAIPVCVLLRACGMDHGGNRLFSIYCYFPASLNRGDDCITTHGCGFYFTLCLDGACFHFGRSWSFVDNFNLAV